MLLLHPSPSGSWLGGSSPIRLGSLSLPTRKPSPVSPMSSEKPYLQLTHWIFWDRLSSPQFLKAKTLACETSEPACFTESKAVTSCDKSSDTSDTSVAQKRKKRGAATPRWVKELLSEQNRSADMYKWADLSKLQLHINAPYVRWCRVWFQFLSHNSATLEAKRQFV